MVRYLLQLEGYSSLNLDMWNVYRFTTEIESFEEDLWNTAVQWGRISEYFVETESSIHLWSR